jgi:hypothetical protein
MRTTAVTAALLALLSGAAVGQESKIALIDAPGKDKAMQCTACHSLDYIQMNSRFLDVKGWTGTVNKMINVFGAPIPKEDVTDIAGYLAHNYGKPDAK